MIRTLVRHVGTIVPAASVGLAFGILVTGCARPPEQPPVGPGPGPTLAASERGATIMLKRDGDGKVTGFYEPVSDDLKSDRKKLGLSKSRNHTARWILFPSGMDVTVTVQMDTGEAPFDGPIKCHADECKSPRLDPKLTPPAEGQEFSYTVKVKDNRTGAELKMDPIIRVDP